MKEWTQAAIIVGLLLIGGFYLGGVFDDDATTPGVDTDTGIVCESGTTVTVTLALTDKYSSGTSQGNTYHYIREVGSTAWTTVANAATTTFAPYTEVEYLLDFNETTGYGVYGTTTLPCQTTYKIEGESADFITSNVTGTFWNSAGTASTAQAMTMGDVKNVKFQFVGSYKDDLGNAQVGYNLLNCKANSSQIDDFIISGLEKYTSKPSNITTTSGYDDYTFKFPVLESNAETPIYTVTVDASDTVEVASDIVCTVFDTNYYVNSDNGQVESGVQTEDKANVGIQDWDAALYGVVTIDLS